MNNFVRKVVPLLEGGQGFVLVTIIAQAGSTPRAAGTRMAVLADGTIIGTIGGGEVEALAIEAAVALGQDDAGKAAVRDYDLNSRIPAGGGQPQMVCGGRLTLLLEKIIPGERTKELFRALQQAQASGIPALGVARMLPNGSQVETVQRCLISGDDPWAVAGENFFGESDPRALLERHAGGHAPQLMVLPEGECLLEPVVRPRRLFIFGAGHVAEQLAPLAANVNFETVVIDDRREFADPRRFPTTTELHVVKTYENSVAQLALDAHAFIVICTRGHNFDKIILGQALDSGAAYIGMLGSQRKRETIYKALQKEGAPAEALARVHCPVGLAIQAQTPAEIAVSIVAQLIRVRAQ